MAPAGTGCYLLLLLLLLGLWLADVPVSAKPKHMTSAQWFETQHVQLNPKSCSEAMGKINKHKEHCKGFNTFLHESFSSVAATCQTSTIDCKNGRKNCHQSKGPVSLTICQHISGKYPNCKYQGTKKTASYVIACDPPQKRDSDKSLVPVHFERIL